MAKLRASGTGENGSPVEAGSEPARRSRAGARASRAPRGPIATAADQLIEGAARAAAAGEPAGAPARARRPRKPVLPSAEASLLGQTVALAVAAPVESRRPVGYRDLLGEAVGIRLDKVSRAVRCRVGRPALEEVSLQIAPGEFVAVLGPSGAGKSTLLHLMSGIDQPTAGRVFAAGAPLDQLGRDGVAGYRLQRVGCIHRAPTLIPTLTAAQNVALPLAIAGVPAAERAERVRRLLDLVGLGDRGGARPGRLSTGEQQRIAVARALANRPGLILADEPTGNLDSAAGAAVLDLLSELNRRGATVVVATHDPEVATRADRVIRLTDGRLGTGASPDRAVLHAPAALEPTRPMPSREAIRLGLSALARRPSGSALAAAVGSSGVGLTALILALAGGLREAAGRQPSELVTEVGLALGALVVVAGVGTGIGLAATLHSSVGERRREIAALKAIGARAADLRLMFVTEAALVGIFAGLIGVLLAQLLGGVGNGLVGRYPHPGAPAPQLFHLALPVALLAVLGAILLGAAAGLVSASRAGRLDPVPALHTE